jgi:hypothetical protein
MPNDALDPGPKGDYPHWPRRPDGRPAGIGLPVTTPEEREAEERMPTGMHKQRTPAGRVVDVDLTPRDNETGEPIVPPDIDPTP